MKNSIFVLNNVNIILVNTMKKTLFLLPFFCLLCAVSTLCAADTLFIKETRIPILIERQDNVLFYLRLDAKDSKVLDKVVLKFDEETVLSDIQSVKLYYGGTEALQDVGKKRFAPVEYISSHAPGKTLAANPFYSIKKAEVNNPKNEIVLKGEQKLFPGIIPSADLIEDLAILDEDYARCIACCKCIVCNHQDRCGKPFIHLLHTLQQIAGGFGIKSTGWHIG